MLFLFSAMVLCTHNTVAEKAAIVGRRCEEEEEEKEEICIVIANTHSLQICFQLYSACLSHKTRLTNEVKRKRGEINGFCLVNVVRH